MPSSSRRINRLYLHRGPCSPAQIRAPRDPEPARCPPIAPGAAEKPLSQRGNTEDYALSEAMNVLKGLALQRKPAPAAAEKKG